SAARAKLPCRAAASKARSAELLGILRRIGIELVSALDGLLDQISLKADFKSISARKTAD
ncbi:hypothetical protein M3616_23515, partial [Bacillus velezensis]|nr:hypothetical protein [Bacillus velezensis]